MELSSKNVEIDGKRTMFIKKSLNFLLQIG